jgi:phosphate transport system substrate-binding protein
VNRRILASALAITAIAAPVAVSATTIRSGGSTGLQLLAQKLANGYHASHPGVTITVAGGGSGAGISGAKSGRFSIGDSSRLPKGSDPTGLTFTPIDKEPFVVIVNPKNPIKSLTRDQIRDIFTGVVTNWHSLGGPNATIKVYSRVGTSGTLGTFECLFLDRASPIGECASSGVHVTSRAPKLGSNGLDRSAVAGNPYAISFVTYAYTVGTSVVRALKVANVSPTLGNVSSGAYRYSGYQFFVTKGAPSGAVASYIAWVNTSAAAKAIIKKYALPLTPSQVRDNTHTT